MKTLLAAVNSQYIHSCLAVWRLKAACGADCGEICVKEWNINQQREHIFREIYEIKPDVIGFSCYIWNIRYVLILAEELKQVLPESKIILGGPEVSFDSKNLMDKYSFIDAVIMGEGEQSLPELLKQLNQSQTAAEIPGTVIRQNNKIFTYGDYQFLSNFSVVPSPYTAEMLEETKGKIIYYESTRGCPFRCAYCLSQIGKGVREIPTEQVCKDIEKFQKAGLKLLKFVDRTFNCNPARTLTLWKYIQKLDCDMCFHFEIGGDLLDRKQLSVLKNMPAGRVQLEIGIQSTNLQVLDNVCRKTDWNKLKENAAELISYGNIHIHLDLIAGLPGEDFQSFRNSFNEVYALHPHDLQLGFLKLIKGSRLRSQADENGCLYRREAPYEVLQTKDISAGELLRLKDIEEVLERFYNSGKFVRSLIYLENFFSSPFDFYEMLSKFHADNGFLHRPMSAAAQYEALYTFALPYLKEEQTEYLRTLLKFDYLVSGLTGKTPEFFSKDNVTFSSKEWSSAFLSHDGFELHGLQRPSGVREMNQRYRFEFFQINPVYLTDEPVVIVFDRCHKNAVTGLLRYELISIV